MKFSEIFCITDSAFICECAKVFLQHITPFYSVRIHNKTTALHLTELH